MNSKKKFTPCDYVSRAKDNQPKPLTKAYFLSLLEDINVRMSIEKIREHKPDAEAYKRNLPGICWQSRFNGKLRTDANAQPTGLYCLDVDIHHEPEFKEILQTEGADAAYKWAEQEARERAERWAQMQKEEDSGIASHGLDICGVHISPSGTGVHVIACCHSSCKNIAENQARLARLLGTSYDEVCKDWARIFFITPRGDWTYLDMGSIFEEE